MEMVETEITYEELFDLISQEENIEFKIDEEYFQQMPIEIFDENDQWTPVKGLIKKEAKIVTLKLVKNGEICCITTAYNHQFFVGGELIFAHDLTVGDSLDDYTITEIKIGENSQVYDVEVDNDSHLYKCALGITHHNTLLTSAIIKYANQLNMRAIVIVPTSSLLKQTHDYIEQFDIPIGKFGGGRKDDEPNIVATWQSLQNQMAFIKNFECIVWDEVHGAKAYVAQQIMQTAINSFMRIGLTGTVPKSEADKANLTAAFGPVTYDVRAFELQQRKILSNIHISIFKLVYSRKHIDDFAKKYLHWTPEKDKKGKDQAYKFVDWHEETMFLQMNDLFHVFMKALLETLENNTLILLKNIQPAEELAEILGCTYISSSLSEDEKQAEFDKFVYGGNQISVGTYKLLSTGLDIVHINNMVLGPTPGKSFTTCIQSIGRGLRRKGGQKEHVNVVDLTSSLTFDRKHIRTRISYYKEAKYPYEEDKMKMDQFDIGPPSKMKKK